jgi:hypothetical protein
MEIKNKTKRALAVSLPGGKKLRLGPGKTGQITPKAADFPAVQKLIEADELELIGGGRGPGSHSTGGNSGATKSQTGGGGGASLRHTGDR